MVEVAVDHSCFLGEGPVWDSSSSSLFWVDILAGDIHELNTLGGLHKVVKVNQMVGAVAKCDDGNLLAAMQSGLSIINRTNGEITTISHPEQHLPANRFNDGKCDPLGRFWIGTMAIDETPRAGGLYTFNSKHQITKKIENTTISNGMAWSLDHTLFYYIDTPTMTIVAYDYDKQSGYISNRRIAFIFDENDGYPDGMTIDIEGMLWVAHWNGWQVSRWNPVTGKKLFSLPLPVANVTSCTFGGNDLQDLYITTARKGLSPDELNNQPLAGKLFVWRNSGYKGIRAFEYKILNT